MGMSTDRLLTKLHKWVENRERKEKDSTLLREAIEHITEYRRLSRMYAQELHGPKDGRNKLEGDNDQK